MGYKGPENIREKITETLDPKILVDLAADLLFSKSFSNIHRTDGPGDGGRDLYAESKGEKILVQCKYHEDYNKPCSSRELSELPMALVKFNYTKGIFITNAKISPQAKREYLDNYPNLKLLFVDGDELGLSIVEDPLLRSIWLDGESIYKKEPSIRVPFLIREHIDDLPYVINEHACKTSLSELDRTIRESFPKLKIRIRSNRTDTKRFEPYKAPLPLTVEEGGSYSFLFSELIVEGTDSLADIEPFKSRVKDLLITWLKDRLNGFSLRFGKSYVAPRNNDEDGTEIELDSRPETYIVTKSFIGPELSFYNIGEQLDWTSTNDARVSEAGYIRLYNEELNVCLDYKIKSRIGWNEQLEKLASKERLKIAWEKSVFCLSEAFASWPFSDIQEPDEHIAWIDDESMICGWLHFSLLGYPSETRSRSSEGFGKFMKLPDEADFAKEQEAIKSKLLDKKGIKIIEPATARHMIAISGNDMFDIPEEYIYICGEVVDYPEGIPSPILPNSRQFHLELALINEVYGSFLDLKFLEKVNSLPFVSDVEAKGANNSCHICISLDIESIEHNDTKNIVFCITKMASQIVDIVNSDSPEGSFIVTREFWKANFNVSLGSSWKDSNKTYEFTSTSDEPMDYQDIMRILTS